MYVFGDNKYGYAFWVCLLSLPILIFNSIPYSILLAFQNVKLIAKLRIISSITTLLLSISLIYFFGLKGAVFSILLSHAFNLIIHYYFARKAYFSEINITSGTILHAKNDSKLQKELITFSGFGLTIGTYVILSELVCRAIVINQLGIDTFGLYSPAIFFALSNWVYGACFNNLSLFKPLQSRWK